MIDPTPLHRPLQADGRLHGVAIACRRPDGKYLCIRRAAGVAAPLRVCFPGGAIEVGEAPAAAVAREMLEELGVEVRPIANVCRWDQPRLDLPGVSLTLWGWTAELLSENLRPDPLEVAQVLWLSGTEAIDHPDAMPSNRYFVNCLEGKQ